MKLPFTTSLFARAGVLLASAAPVACGALDDDESSSGSSVTGSEIPEGSPQPESDCVPDLNCQPEPPGTGDFHEDCVRRVNQFRLCVCLPPLARNHDGENCADEHARYDSDPSRGAHAGFRDDICEPRGMAQNECPGWRSDEQVIGDCLQSMFDEGPPPSSDCSGQCFQQHGHHMNMTGDYSSVSCGLYDAGGEIWSVQNFHP